MYSSRVLDGGNSQSVHTEALAWLKVMEELAFGVPEIGCDRQDEARRLIGEAETALRSCASKSTDFADPLVANAQEAVKSVLEFFPERTELVNCVFFLALSTCSLSVLLDCAEELDVNKVSKRQRQRLRKSMESALDTLDAKLREMERALEDSDSPDSP